MPRPRSALGKKTGTHFTGVLVNPRARLDTEVWGKVLFPCRESNPDRPVAQSVVRHYTDWATLVPRIFVKPNEILMSKKVGHLLTCYVTIKCSKKSCSGAFLFRNYRVITQLKFSRKFLLSYLHPISSSFHVVIPFTNLNLYRLQVFLKDA
jgi:hypothetical protein